MTIGDPKTTKVDISKLMVDPVVKNNIGYINHEYSTVIGDSQSTIEKLINENRELKLQIEYYEKYIDWLETNYKCIPNWYLSDPKSIKEKYKEKHNDGRYENYI